MWWAKSFVGKGTVGKTPCGKRPTHKFIFFLCVLNITASLHKLAAGRKLATTHLNVSNRRMCGCTGFKSGSYNKSYYN